MKTNQVHILSLIHDIYFRDSDEGDCYAGEGRRIISAHKTPAVPHALAAEFNPVIAQAEKENIVYPIQKYNRTFKKQFGFTLHDIDDGCNFKLVVDTFDIEPLTLNPEPVTP